MGNLINPISSRLGYVRYWDSLWATTSPSNYALTASTNNRLNDYVAKLLQIVASAPALTEYPKITSFKIFYTNDIAYFLFHFWLDEFTEDYAPIREFFIDKVAHSMRRKFARLMKTFTKQTAKKSCQLIKSVQLKGKDNLKHMLPKKPAQPKPSKPKVTITADPTPTFAYLDEVFSKEIFKDMRRTPKHNAYTRQRVIFEPMLKHGITLQRQLLLTKRPRFQIKKIRTVTPINPIWKRFIALVLYKTKLQPVKQFIQLSVSKYLLNTKSIRFVFIRHSPNLLTADILAGYVVGRLKVNYSLRALIGTFIRNMRYQLHAGQLLGFKIVCSGRFARRGRASYEWKSIGKVPNTNFDLDLDYTLKLVTLTNSICAVKIWLVRTGQNEEKITIL